MQKPLVEFDYISDIKYNNPFFDISLDVVFTHEDGEQWTVPAFCRGDNRWSVRFCAPKSGEYQARSICSNNQDEGLHHFSHSFQVSKSDYFHPLYRHGKLSIREKKFIFEDGTPFFWLGDTWWMALSNRLKFPEEFELLLEDRKQKGFTLIQLVAGLFPDMDLYDQRGANEAGFSWKGDLTAINPAYFDEADKRIERIVDAGLVPFVFGAWGYYLSKIGEERMRIYWRYLIARWSAYPVIWSLAGEVSMPWYLSNDRDVEHRKLCTAWTRIGRYIKQIDPYDRLLSAHPVHVSYSELDNTDMLDFEMLQTGHGDLESIRNTIGTIQRAKDLVDAKPIVLSEVTYEGILGQNDATIQRLAFWISILLGIDGFTYGANGIWQVNGDDEPFGESPNGNNWGNTPWKKAMMLPGSTQISFAKQLLERYDWFHLEAMSHTLSSHGDAANLFAPFCAGVGRELRIIYCGDKAFLFQWKRLQVAQLEPLKNYELLVYDAASRKKEYKRVIQSNKHGIVKLPRKTFENDWILILSLKIDS